jgi:hypothetical protein
LLVTGAVTVGGIAGIAAGAEGGKGAEAGAGAGVSVNGGVIVGAYLPPPGSAVRFWTGGAGVWAGAATAPGAGMAGAGNAGSADALPPAKTTTPMKPAAMPPMNIRHDVRAM